MTMAKLACVALLGMALGIGCGNDGSSSGSDADAQSDAGTRDTRDTERDAATGPSGLDFAAFDQVVESFVEDEELEGVSVALVDRERGLVHLSGYGDFAADRIYAIASSTKIVTAGVIMRLVDQGVLDLEEPIGTYVADVWGDGYGKEDLTLAQLLSMSGGLPGLGSTDYEPYACFYTIQGSLAACAQQLYEADDTAERAEPDTQFDYGGPTYQLAGGVAMVASGKDWDTLLQETYAPCGTDSLGYSNFWESGEGYPADFQGDPDNAPETENFQLAGGAYVNAEDYASLLLMHLRGGLCGDDRVLSEDSVDRMQVDRVAEVYDGGTWFSGQGYGLGWWVNRERSVVSDFGAFGTAAWLDTELGYGAFIGMEGDFGAGSAVYEATQPVLDEIFEQAAR